MKSLLLTITIVFLASACDSPQRNRLVNNSLQGNGLNQPNNTGNINNNGNSNVWDTGTNTTAGSTGGNTSSNPPGFENCDKVYYASMINYIGICQSTLDETMILAKPTLSDSNRTCLIPTYKDDTGSSTYLGQPQCFTPQENIATQGKLYKTRSGFTHFPINGLMVMKEGSLSAYFTCMDAYVSFVHPQCPYGGKTNAYCDQMAKQEMAFKCNNFKADHPYIDINTKL